jgi:hypothetical protein
VPPNFRDLNLKAFDKGFEYGNGTGGEGRLKADLEELAYAEE